MAWMKRSITAMKNWFEKAKMNIEEPETEPVATPENTHYVNFKVVPEPGVYDPEKGEISYGGYDYFDEETGKEVSIQATGAPAATDDKQPPVWLTYDLLYVKTLDINKTHDLYPPKLPEGSEIYSPEDFCNVTPIVAKKVEILFWMDDITQSKDGYCEGTIYVGLEDEEPETKTENKPKKSVLPSVMDGLLQEGMDKKPSDYGLESYVRIAESKSIEEFRKDTKKEYDNRQWALKGKCAIRLHSDVMTNSVGTLPADYKESLTLPIGVYPVRLGYSTADRMWLPEIDSKGSSMPLANLFIKGWSDKKSLIKTRNSTGTELENSYEIMRPWYSTPQYEVKSESYKVPYAETKKDKDGNEIEVVEIKEKNETLEWAEQTGFIRTTSKSQITAMINDMKSNKLIKDLIDPTLPESLDFYKHDNGNIVYDYNKTEKQNDFWHKLCSLLAANGGQGELTIIQKRESTEAMIRAHEEQDKLDNPEKYDTGPIEQTPGLLVKGIGKKPSDYKLESFVRIEGDKKIEIAEYKKTADDLKDEKKLEEAHIEMANAFNDKLKTSTKKENQKAKNPT